MKKNRNISVSSAKRKIAWFCLLAWIVGIFGHDCAAADDDEKPDGICTWICGICCCCAAGDVDDQKSDDICPVTLPAQQEQEEEGTINIRLLLEKEKPSIGREPFIPPVARGYEEIYRRFFNGVLIYRPGPESDDGMIKLPIRDLTNPLEGTFDLSRCGDAGEYLSISTGYRKGKKPENAKKVEIWICPRFLIEKELNTTAKYFKVIYDGEWEETAEVGMFWTWGETDDMRHYHYPPVYDYLTTRSMDNLSKINLYENWRKSDGGYANTVFDIEDIYCNGPTPIFFAPHGQAAGAASRHFSCSFDMSGSASSAERKIPCWGGAIHLSCGARI